MSSTVAPGGRAGASTRSRRRTSPAPAAACAASYTPGRATRLWSTRVSIIGCAAPLSPLPLPLRLAQRRDHVVLLARRHHVVERQPQQPVAHVLGHRAVAGLPAERPAH